MSENAAAQTSESVAKGRSRWWPRLVGVVVALVLLVVAAEVALRLIVPKVVAGSIRDSFGLTADHPVEVSMTGSAALNAVAGRLADVAVTVPQVTVPGGAVVTVEAQASGLPFAVLSQPMQSGSASVTIPADQLGVVVALATHGIADSGEVSDGALRIGRSIDVFGVSVPLEALLGLSVESGNVRVDPLAISAVGVDLTAEQLQTITGGAFDGLLTAHVVCVKDQLPAGVTLRELALSTTGAVTVTADLAPDILSNPAQLETGSCD